MVIHWTFVRVRNTRVFTILNSDSLHSRKDSHYHKNSRQQRHLWQKEV